MPWEIINPHYVASAVERGQVPELGLPEVAFIGRSNVGKSSLINSLCRFNNLARSSGQPGKTRTQNYFQVTFRLEQRREDLMFVDLPGYGYAHVGKEEKRQLSVRVREYLATSPRLRLIFQLIDIRHGPLESDLEVHGWLRGKGFPVAVVATKADKLTRSKVKPGVQQIAKKLELEDAYILAHSATSGEGRDVILDYIARTVGWNGSDTV